MDKIKDIESYLAGYRAGYNEGIFFMTVRSQEGRPLQLSGAEQREIDQLITLERQAFNVQKKRKRRQSPKQKLLTEMTAKKWNQYKKGSGKKTYLQIRAMVSRSQEYKRKAKKL